MNDCPLCKREELTELIYEDAICWVTRCATHPSKHLIVLKRHVRNPTQEELKHMKKIAEKLFPRRKWRTSETGSIPEHFHLHEL